MKWQPRYVAYALANGRSPDDQQTHDRKVWPGGVNAGFVLWLSARWEAWDKLHKLTAGHFRDDEEHSQFTRWLLASLQPRSER